MTKYKCCSCCQCVLLFHYCHTSDLVLHHLHFSANILTVSVYFIITLASCLSDCQDTLLNYLWIFKLVAFLYLQMWLDVYCRLHYWMIVKFCSLYCNILSLFVITCSFSLSPCVCFRHPSGEFSYGNTSVTVKMMNQEGVFLPGELTQDLGYVSTLIQVHDCHCYWLMVINL